MMDRSDTMVGLVLTVLLAAFSSATASCVTYECNPDCTSRSCGDDGCGGSCGECSPQAGGCHGAECMDGTCVEFPLDDDTTCGEAAECSEGRCQDGTCIRFPTEGSCSTDVECHEGQCRDGECVAVPIVYEVLGCDSMGFNLEVCWNGAFGLSGCPATCEGEGHNATRGCSQLGTECDCDDVDAPCVVGEYVCGVGRGIWWCSSAENAGSDYPVFLHNDCSDMCTDADWDYFDYCGYDAERGYDICFCGNW